MIKNIQIISKQSQVKELGNLLKYKMLKELIRTPATCQQLADALGFSKQKIHYNLNKLSQEGLISIVEDASSNGKEVYYRATAKNYVLDFSLGEHLGGGNMNYRKVIDKILEEEYQIHLSAIAAKLIKDSLKLKARQKLLIVTGKFNLPFVEKLLLEAGRLNIHTTLIYRDSYLLQAKYDEYSLTAFKADYDNFNRMLKAHDAYLNLNGEARFIELANPDKFEIPAKAHAQSNQTIQKQGIRVAMMPGLLNDTITESSIESEKQFWQALDVDYEALRDLSLQICQKYASATDLKLSSDEGSLFFNKERIFAECGSFTEDACQSPVINYPGGEVLILPKSGSAAGMITGDIAYAFGEKIVKPRIEIVKGEITHFSAAENEELLKKAIESGGEDGRKLAMVCMGTNPNVSLSNIDMSYLQKSQGIISLWWGDNRFAGGDIQGLNEWFILVKNPQLITLDGE